MAALRLPDIALRHLREFLVLTAKEPLAMEGEGMAVAGMEMADVIIKTVGSSPCALRQLQMTIYILVHIYSDKHFLFCRPGQCLEKSEGCGSLGQWSAAPPAGPVPWGVGGGQRAWWILS